MRNRTRLWRVRWSRHRRLYCRRCRHRHRRRFRLPHRRRWRNTRRRTRQPPPQCHGRPSKVPPGGRRRMVQLAGARRRMEQLAPTLRPKLATRSLQLAVAPTAHMPRMATARRVGTGRRRPIWRRTARLLLRWGAWVVHLQLATLAPLRVLCRTGRAARLARRRAVARGLRQAATHWAVRSVPCRGWRATLREARDRVDWVSGRGLLHAWRG
mmetsp:Transcript_20162/g.59899  ORF Transcript_20162/g.59899 Transcript_20162/m.59899 type:complete len:212 (+) Transcript_20162:1677-2312(+)